MLKKLATSLALTGLLAGCASRRLAPPPPAQLQPAQMLSTDFRNSAPIPKADDPRVIQLLMYQLTVPFGSVSQSDAFWKLANEDCLGVADQDILQKNGLRAGRGSIQDWPKFCQVIDQVNTSYQTARFAGASDEDVQLDMVPKVDEQTLFVFNRQGELVGRSFGESHNRFSFRFQWVPRKVDTVRIQICPVVATKRTRDDYSVTDDPIDADYSTIEHLYDLHFKADIAPGEFLIVGVTPDGRDPNRIGHQFLTVDGPSDRYEKVLIIVAASSSSPIPLKLEKAHAPTTQPIHPPAAAAPRTK